MFRMPLKYLVKSTSRLKIAYLYKNELFDSLARIIFWQRILLKDLIICGILRHKKILPLSQSYLPDSTKF